MYLHLLHEDITTSITLNYLTRTPNRACQAAGFYRISIEIQLVILIILHLTKVDCSKISNSCFRRQNAIKYQAME